jgi:thiol-disulfide isomerase/thioredoxin
MKTRNRFWAAILVAGALLLGPMLLKGVRAADPVKPADDKAEKKVEAKRTQQQIIQELSTATEELRAVLASPLVLFDAKKRAEAAPKAIPAMKKLSGLFEELGQTNDGLKMQAANARIQLLALMSLMGDADSATILQKGAESKDAAEALRSQSAQLSVRWWKASDNAAEQGKVLDDLQKLAQANEKDDGLAQIVMGISQQGAANKELRERAEKIIINDLKGESAKHVAEQIQSEGKLRALEGKPLTIEGIKVGGGKFSSADWKGKVILVDFWATWCGPCIAELPRVKKAYADFHDKGLELLGVSCDNKEDALKTFLEKNAEMAWPQLFDAAKPGWHALATGYGIQAIPTMFLIDRKGILRSVEARENFEEMIPKLLAEKAE